jgi:hypothetical protein
MAISVRSDRASDQRPHNLLSTSWIKDRIIDLEGLVSLAQSQVALDPFYRKFGPKGQKHLANALDRLAEPGADLKQVTVWTRIISL